jgi:uncharacterized protein (DUF1015 family)
MDIRPFVAHRYDPKVAGSVARVVSPPFDQYSKEMQAAAYKLSPYHYVRLILPRDDNPHEAAAKTLEQWLADGVLVPDAAPAIYPYSQAYRDPRGTPHVRHGFLALLRLTPLEGGPIYPHERTMPKTLADRLELMRATRADFGPIFITFPDADGDVTRLLKEAQSGKPAISVPDSDGNRHDVWVQADTAWQQKLIDLMQPVDGVIADGHHRYKAALQYADEIEVAGGGDSPARFKLVALFPAFADNLTVFPVHRVVEAWPQSADPEPFFAVERKDHLRLENLQDAVAASPGMVGVFTRKGGVEVWTHRDDAPMIWDSEPSEIYRRLPAAAFEASVLRGLMGMSQNRIALKDGLHYVRHVNEARQLIWKGFERAFFLPPTPLDAIITAARAGELMPQKSTYFYPKLLSGLVSYLHDRS